MENQLADKLVESKNISLLPVGKQLKYYLIIIVASFTTFFLSLFCASRFFSFNAAMISAIISGVLGIVFIILPYKPMRCVSVLFNMLLMGFAVSLVYIKLGYSVNLLNYLLITLGMIVLFAAVTFLLLFNVGVSWLPSANILFCILLLITAITLFFTLRFNEFIYVIFGAVLLLTNAISLKIFVFECDKFLYHVALANCISAFVAVGAVIIVLACLSEGEGCEGCCEGCGGCDCGNGSARGTKNKFKIVKK